jgi:GTPase involved in cell partitioning and DNA repair
MSCGTKTTAGLIEGAHLGAGLGIQFLKHIERTSVIVHLVDVSDSSAAASGNARPDPVHDYKVITEELKSFDPALAAKPTILVAAKVDVANPEKLKKLAAMAKRLSCPSTKSQPSLAKASKTSNTRSPRWSRPTAPSNSHRRHRRPQNLNSPMRPLRQVQEDALVSTAAYAEGRNLFR